jgi:hypothetical protein
MHRLTLLTIWFGLLACAPGAEVVVLLSSAPSAGTADVYFVPVDPAPLLPPIAAERSPAERDTLELLASLADSARALDTEFAEAREDLNAEAAALANLDRRTSEYADRYDDLKPLTLRAESLLQERDAIRAREVALRSAALHLLPTESQLRSQSELARAALLSASSESRSTVVRSVTGNTVTVKLTAGEWWIGASSQGGIPMTYNRITAAGSVRDSVRISVEDR